MVEIVTKEKRTTGVVKIVLLCPFVNIMGQM